MGALLEEYNSNIYINVLKYLDSKLSEVEAFLISIGETKNYKNIDELEQFFDEIFTDDIINAHINYKVTKIVHSLSFWRNETDLDRSNSYYHLTLTLKSDTIRSLDELYKNVLTKILRFYKHLFSKIDNFYVTFKTDQLEAFGGIVTKIKNDIDTLVNYTAHREVLAQRMKLDPQKLSNIPFGGLFYITSIENVASILQHGILSHNLAHSKGVVKVDISNQTVNARRNRFDATLGGNIHDYSPLYFNHKNPMLYTLCKNGDRNKLALIRVNPHILLASDVAFSDGNAASGSTHFYKNIEDFNKINWTLIKNGSWYNYEFGIEEGRRIMCSEVLVKNRIPLFVINNIIVYDEAVLDSILPLFPNHLGIKVQVDKKLYF